ncbi:reverse transcriptase [Senna tora]|uniref:Reverse transcriptase n=1 Tax=Senna tora TaxID=362788 RepID=A0A835CB13_9FABA|nr:reverse transcriptase [Senna tora]
MMAESMYYRISDPAIREVLMELRSRGLGLAILPHLVQSQGLPEPEINLVHLDTTPPQLLQMLYMGGKTITLTLKGSLPEGAFIMEAHRPVLGVCVTSYMKLGSRALEYQFAFEPQMGKKQLTPFSPSSSDSYGYVGQNFDETNRFMDFKTLIWNARGAGNPEFRRVLMDLKLRYRPNVVFISETRIEGWRADSVINTLGFDSHFKVDPIGYAGGLWILWDTDNVKLTVVEHTFQEVHAIMEAWHEANSTSPGLDIISERAIEWNKAQFGNVFLRKKQIIKRLEGIGIAMSQSPKPHLVPIEQELAFEYQKILRLEEELWASKARLDWLNLGDSNTSFFHASVIKRRRINRITVLKGNVGNWINDYQGIKNHVVEYFTKYFTGVPIEEFPTEIRMKTIDQSIHNSLETIPSSEEIRRALWDLKPYKAAGIDGFQPGFFQKCWGFLGEDICREVKSVFVNATIPSEWNQTMICLIPKCQNPAEVKNFRPISLCTSLYKIVSKIVVNRLKPLIPDLVSFNQRAFVPGRKVGDNVIIAHEVVHVLQKKTRGKRGWMMIKLDLEKAYDKINWDFILNTLLRVNMPTKLVDLVKSCISSVSHCMLTNWVQGKCWTPVKIRGVQISHLLYADDVLLFARTDKKSIMAIKNVLTRFANCSGLSFNSDKSSVWFSLRAPEEDKHSVTHSLGFGAASNPGKYLGVPLGLSRRTSDYRPIMDKVMDKVECWKGKYLSKAGKATLINSVQRSISAIACNSDSNDSDKNSWKLTPTGFSLKTAYDLACKFIPSQSIETGSMRNFKWLWKLPCTPKIKNFVRQLSLNALPCRGTLYSRGPKGLDAIDIDPTNPNDFNELCDWVHFNALKDIVVKYDIAHGVFFIFGIWEIWTARNALIFENIAFDLTAVGKRAIFKAMEFFHLTEESYSLPPMEEIFPGLPLRKVGGS